MNTRSGVRLDAALLDAFPTSTKAFVKDAIAKGNVLLSPEGGKPSVLRTKGLKLRGGETILVKQLLETEDNLVMPLDNRDSLDIRQVHCDDALLAFDKPAGIPVQPLSCRETGTLMNAVVTRHPECRQLGPRLSELGENPLMAGALHRIDTGTSGLVLVARSIESYEALRAQFAAQTVEKTYLALVEGSFTVGGTLENDLVHDPTLPFCRMIDANHTRYEIKATPFHAITKFDPIAHTSVENEERTLLKVTIFTGVTHQIRAQLALAGMHIINDRLYGAFAVENQIGHCLHALSAKFLHPLTGEPMEIATPLPSWASRCG